MPETFTIEEARGLIPWLQEIFDSTWPVIDKLVAIRQDILRKSHSIQSNGGGNVEGEIVKAKESLQEAEDEINRLVAPIVDRNILIKSVERGLIDFPSMIDGELVYLCWQAGEPELMYWHTIDSGFLGRQPL